MPENIKQRTIRRVKLCEINVKVNGDSLQCVSRLSYGKDEITSKVESSNTPSNRKKAVAQSVLDGIRKLMNLQELFVAKDVIVNTLEDMTFISVVAEISMDKSIDRTIGSSIVKTDINEAVGRAALDAVNRRIEKILSNQ
jgi:hypothetical protein